MIKMLTLIKMLFMFIFKFLYRLFLMPYLEREKYFEELVDDVYENDIPKILNKLRSEKHI
jgi:hypothetical protein